MNNKVSNNSRRPNEAKRKFPFVPLLVVVISFILLVYSVFGIVVFAHTLSSAGAEGAIEETVTADDGTPIEKGNLKFTTEELFNISDAKSTGGTILLFVFCTLSIASIVALVFSYRAIAKSPLSKKIKAVVIAAGTILSLIAAVFFTYGIAQAQLDWFKDKKDDSAREHNNVNVDEGGFIYFIDGNGAPYLSLEIEDDSVNNEIFAAASKALNISKLDHLYVNCDYKTDDSGKVTITGFYVDDDEGRSLEAELRCLSNSEDATIYYQVTLGSFSARYKLLNSSGDVTRTDLDAKTTFLIVGKDRVGSNTDVMILVSLREEDGKYKADILQIPRDTFCRDNSLNNKINSVYASYRRQSDASSETDLIFAGMNGLKSVLERNWLIKIDYWAIMNLDGFGKIVDGIGGVDMYVPFNMDYDDPTAVPQLHIHLKEGQQTLYANEAEQFIRYRKGYVTGDLGRVDATKLFLTAFFCKLRSELSITNPSALTNTISTLMDYVTTNMDTGNAISFVKMVLQLSLEDITFINLPGSDYARAPAPYENVSYYTSNRAGMYYVVNKFFNVYDDPINENEFDASRMFTTQNKYTALDNAHSEAFDVEAYEQTLKGADEIQQSQENQENNLPVVGRLRN